MKQYLQRVLLICAGFFIIGTGGSVFVYSNLGADPLNLLSQGAAGIFHLPVGTVNSLLQFVIGLLLGGVFGIGTVISALLTGPSIQWGLSLIEKIKVY